MDIPPQPKSRRSTPQSRLSLCVPRPYSLFVGFGSCCSNNPVLPITMAGTKLSVEDYQVISCIVKTARPSSIHCSECHVYVFLCTISNMCASSYLRTWQWSQYFLRRKPWEYLKQIDSNPQHFASMCVLSVFIPSGKLSELEVRHLLACGTATCILGWVALV